MKTSQNLHHIKNKNLKKEKENLSINTFALKGSGEIKKLFQDKQDGRINFYITVILKIIFLI
jgi:hypothetical protein